VLFSEPKIPQFSKVSGVSDRAGSFSALQRAENSSIGARGWYGRSCFMFQCSSASRKFLNTLLFS